ncbi:MAG: hypothetical protein NT166_21485 [Candidatus Aminicenantes bacterium]|nr:hypothetical protein [Candidatus Aminicenantes bacterium]
MVSQNKQNMGKMKIKEVLKQFKETPAWWLAIPILAFVLLKIHLIVLSLPYLGMERLLLTVLALLAMFFLGLTGFSLSKVSGSVGTSFQRGSDPPEATVLVPLILIIAGDYLNFSSLHLDVNPLAAVWVALLYWCIFTFLEKDTLLHKVLIPGVLCGAALTVNYSLFPIVLSPILAIWLFPGNQKLKRIFLLIGVTLAVFLAMIPLSFALFVPLDMLGVGRYSYHHHIHWTLKGLSGNFGVGGLLLSLFGLVTAFKKDWRKPVIFIAFPLLLTLYAFFAVFAALGLIELYRLARERLKLKAIPAAAAVAILFCICFPPYKPVLQWAKAKAEPDSRLRAVQWVRANVPKGASLVVPAELEMDAAPLQDDYQVYTRDFKQLKETTFETLDALLNGPYFLVPEFTVYDVDGLTAKDLKLLEAFKEKSRDAVAFAGNKVLRNYYRPVPAGNPAFSIGRLETKAQLIPSPAVSAVWNANAAAPQDTSPALLTFFEKGKFAYEFTAKQTGNVLEVHSLSADEKGIRQTGFGFEPNRKGFAKDIAAMQGKYIYLVASAAVSPHLAGEDNYIFISSQSGQSGQSGGFGAEKQFFSSPGWRTYILAKKIQPGTTRLIMGFRFTPQSKEDRLTIRHIGIYVSEKPM